MSPMCEDGSLTSRRSNNVAFATADNLESPAILLQSSLKRFGFSGRLNLLSTSSEDLANTFNCLYQLIRRFESETERVEELMQSERRVRNELSISEQTQARMRKDMEGKERDVGSMLIKHHKAKESYTEEIKKLQREREDLTKKVYDLSRRSVQFQHGIRKKEVEYERLQDKLRYYLAEKKREAKASLEIVGRLKKQSLQGKTKPAARMDEDMYKMIVQAYEDKQKELLVENKDLRASLKSMQREYTQSLNRITEMEEKFERNISRIPRVSGGGVSEQSTPIVRKTSAIPSRSKKNDTTSATEGGVTNRTGKAKRNIRADNSNGLTENGGGTGLQKTASKEKSNNFPPSGGAMVCSHCRRNIRAGEEYSVVAFIDEAGSREKIGKSRMMSTQQNSETDGTAINGTVPVESVRNANGTLEGQVDCGKPVHISLIIQEEKVTPPEMADACTQYVGTDIVSKTTVSDVGTHVDDDEAENSKPSLLPVSVLVQSIGDLGTTFDMNIGSTPKQLVEAEVQAGSGDVIALENMEMGTQTEGAVIPEPYVLSISLPPEPKVSSVGTQVENIEECPREHSAETETQAAGNDIVAGKQQAETVIHHDSGISSDMASMNGNDAAENGRKTPTERGYLLQSSPCSDGMSIFSQRSSLATEFVSGDCADSVSSPRKKRSAWAAQPAAVPPPTPRSPRQLQRGSGLGKLPQPSARPVPNAATLDDEQLRVELRSRATEVHDIVVALRAATKSLRPDDMRGVFEKRLYMELVMAANVAEQQEAVVNLALAGLDKILRAGGDGSSDSDEILSRSGSDISTISLLGHLEALGQRVVEISEQESTNGDLQAVVLELKETLVEVRGEMSEVKQELELVKKKYEDMKSQAKNSIEISNNRLVRQMSSMRERSAALTHEATLIKTARDTMQPGAIEAWMARESDGQRDPGKVESQDEASKPEGQKDIALAYAGHAQVPSKTTDSKLEEDHTPGTVEKKNAAVSANEKPGSRPAQARVRSLSDRVKAPEDKPWDAPEETSLKEAIVRARSRQRKSVDFDAEEKKDKSENGPHEFFATLERFKAQREKTPAKPGRRTWEEKANAEEGGDRLRRIRRPGLDAVAAAGDSVLSLRSVDADEVEIDTRGVN